MSRKKQRPKELKELDDGTRFYQISYHSGCKPKTVFVTASRVDFNENTLLIYDILNDKEILSCGFEDWIAFQIVRASKIRDIDEQLDDYAKKLSGFDDKDNEDHW